jgi:hypothetical protein
MSKVVMMELFKYKPHNKNVWCNVTKQDFPVSFKETKLTKVICIIYPKGKRPDLGYAVNNKK